MAVPDFQTIMLPLIQMMGDGREYSLGEMVDFLGREFNLSDEELTERIPSGRQTKFYNRVAWATIHLKKAVVIQNTQRGVFRLTERGQLLLAENLPKINLTILGKYPEFVEFRNAKRPNEAKLVTADPIIEVLRRLTSFCMNRTELFVMPWLPKCWKK